MAKVAFIIAASVRNNPYAEEILQDWIAFLGPTEHVIVEVEPHLNQDKITALYDEGVEIIALGQPVSRALRTAGIWHYTLPHPSGRNINAKLQDKLVGALAYIEKGADDESA